MTTSILDFSYLTSAQLSRLNSTCLRFTNFDNFECLISEANYRPVFYADSSLPNTVNDDLKALASAYDNHMRINNDPRRIYYC